MNKQPDLEAEITRLAKLRPLSYDREQEEVANRLGVHLPTLDQEVEARKRSPRPVRSGHRAGTANPHGRAA
jgi:hypothetical protein